MKAGEFRILNDRLRDRFAKVIGNFALDALARDLSTFPLGSQYTDVVTGMFYVRMGATGTRSDWYFVPPEHSFSLDFNEDYCL